MKLLFVHSWGGFCLAEWLLEEALRRRCAVDVEMRSVDHPAHGLPANDHLIRAAASWKPDLVGFSCHYWSTPAFVEASRWIEHLSPGTQVALGGPQVGARRVAEAFLGRHPSIDWIVRGAGEEALSGILEVIGGRREPEDVPGTSFRLAGEVVHVPRTRGRRLERGPVFHPGNRRLLEALDGERVASYETARGCRERCLYCLYPGEGLQLVDDAMVESEIAFLLGLRVPVLRITDAHFGGTAQRARTLLSAIARHNHRTRVFVYPDPAHVDGEYVRLMREAGAEPTSVGVQSTSDPCLKAIRRRPVHGRAGAVSALLEAFPRVPADVIAGLPGDDPEGFETTLRDVLDMGFGAVNVFRLRIFPGTPLDDDPGRYMGGEEFTLTAAGQVLSSPRFPPRSQERVARLEHAAQVGAVLREARGIVARSGAHVMLLATTCEPGLLWDLRNAVLARTPARLLALLDLLRDAVAALVPETEARAARDAVAADVARHLARRCSEARIPAFFWTGDGTHRSITRVLFVREAGAPLEWALEGGEVAPVASPDHALRDLAFDVLVVGDRGDGKAQG